MTFKKKYEGIRPIDGHIIKTFSFENHEYELWDLCKSIKGMSQFKLVARQPMLHKANWFLVGRDDDLNSSRDSLVMKSNSPGLYEVTKQHIVEHIKFNMAGDRKRFAVSIYYGSKEELKAKLLALHNSI